MEDVFYTPEDFNEADLFNTVDNVKSDRTPLDLLFQVMPELDIELSAKIEEKEVNGKKVFFVDDTYLIATFDTEVNESTVTEIAKMRPQYFVMRDSSAANDNVLDNFEQIFTHYSPDTIRKICSHEIQIQDTRLSDQCGRKYNRHLHRPAQPRPQYRATSKLPDGTMRKCLKMSGFLPAKIDTSVRTRRVPSQSLSEKIDGLGAVNPDVERKPAQVRPTSISRRCLSTNKLYGWSKFIIVVPSIAIREGGQSHSVCSKNTLWSSTEKKARWFDNSSNLNQLDQFSQDAGLNVMIINTQAFAAFTQRRADAQRRAALSTPNATSLPHAVLPTLLAANRPIIMDRAAKMEGSRSSSPKEVHPLFVLNYPRLHRTKHDSRVCPQCPRRFCDRHIVKRIIKLSASR